MRPLSSLATLVACLIAHPAAAGEADAPAPDHTGPGFHASLSGSVDNGALAGTIGARYAITRGWLVGLDVEYNPWVSFEGRRLGLGAFNSYATFIYRWDVTQHVALRATFHVGASVLLFDLVGAPAGSTGPLVGGNILGLSYEVADEVYLLLDPAQIMLPAPQIRGAPLVYHQYRLTLGLQVGG